MTRTTREWLVYGPKGNVWVEAKDGDDACERYRVRWQLAYHDLDIMEVIDVRKFYDPCIHGPGVTRCGHPDCVGERWNRILVSAHA